MKIINVIEEEVCVWMAINSLTYLYIVFDVAAISTSVFEIYKHDAIDKSCSRVKRTRVISAYYCLHGIALDRDLDYMGHKLVVDKKIRRPSLPSRPFIFDFELDHFTLWIKVE